MDRVWDTLERIGTTAVEVWLAVVILSGSIPWSQSVQYAGYSALVGVALASPVYPARIRSSYWADTLMRGARTAASVFAAGWMYDGNDADWAHVADVAVLAAVLCLAKCYLSPNAHLSGSLLPTPVIARLQGVELAAGGYR